jgi:hypothetical protein
LLPAIAMYAADEFLCQALAGDIRQSLLRTRD